MPDGVRVQFPYRQHPKVPQRDGVPSLGSDGLVHQRHAMGFVRRGEHGNPVGDSPDACQALWSAFATSVLGLLAAIALYRCYWELPRDHSMSLLELIKSAAHSGDGPRSILHVLKDAQVDTAAGFEKVRRDDWDNTMTSSSWCTRKGQIGGGRSRGW